VQQKLQKNNKLQLSFGINHFFSLSDLVGSSEGQKKKQEIDFDLLWLLYYFEGLN